MNSKSPEELLSKPYPTLFISSGAAKDPLYEERYPGIFILRRYTFIPIGKIYFQPCHYFSGRSVISVLTYIPYSWFSQWSETTVKKRGEDYNAFKHEIGQKIIDQVVHLFPKLKVKTNHLPAIKSTSTRLYSYRYFQNNIDYYSVGTPVTIEHFLTTKEGGSFGMAHDIERFCPKQSSLLRPESGIKGNNGQSNKR